MQIWSSLTADEQTTALSRPAISNSEKLSAQVAEILEAVKLRGDEALRELSKRFDGVRLGNLRVAPETIDAAEAELSQDVIAAIQQAYTNIRTFHEAQVQQDISIDTFSGVNCQLKYAPIGSVGLYIPGGSAPLPSTVLMLGIPAQVAGCKRTVLCTPPDSEGSIAAEIRYAAKLCGIQEVYRVGGAQAVGAMAFGTDSLAAVDKIYGPGNSYVTEAKQQVSQVAGGAAIDMPAGPSEVLVIADHKANPVFVAADLLSQAEHGADSQAIMVCDSESVLEQTKAEVARQLAQLSREEIAGAAMQNSRYILTDNLAQSVAVSNAYAPEHLIVQVENPDALVAQLENAGSIFVGPWSPESAGDYASGTNHVLPTYGYARNYSSLGLADFMRRYTVQTLSADGIRKLGPTIMTLAQAEGLDAHKNAVAVRLEALKEQQV